MNEESVDKPRNTRKNKTLDKRRSNSVMLTGPSSALKKNRRDTRTIHINFDHLDKMLE
jgi:hypothetical protein